MCALSLHQQQIVGIALLAFLWARVGGGEYWERGFWGDCFCSIAEVDAGEWAVEVVEGQRRGGQVKGRLGKERLDDHVRARRVDLVE